MSLAIAQQQALLLEQPIFNRFRLGAFNQNQLCLFAEQYYLSSVAFPGFLGSALPRITDETTRLSLISNLWDEYGRGEQAKFHRVMLSRFVRSCGGASEEHLRPLASTSVYIRGMNALCGSESVGEILGALGPGCEEVTAAEYQIIYDGLRQLSRFTETELEFFTDHIRHDPYHSEGLRTAIDDWVSENGYDAIVHGASQALILESLFWAGIEDECRKLS